MQTFDWIVIGNGLAGAALSYELVVKGLSVLLLDQSLEPASATRFSYGGIPYWAGTTPLTTQLCVEGIAKHRQLADELDADTEFRELDLILTVPAGSDSDVDEIAANYANYAIPPRLISAADAHELEPQLKAAAIAAALTVRHGHVSPTALVEAYNQAFQRRGGTLIIAPVTGLVRIKQRVTGVTTPTQAYAGHQTALAAGAYSRMLLRQAKITAPVYYTQAELLETQPLNLTLRALIMPAVSQRLTLETQASAPEKAMLWDQPGNLIAPPILDSGAIQFKDGRLRIGQISRTWSDLAPEIDAAESEAQMRSAIGIQLPALETVPAAWRRCLVSFSGDRLPLVGPVPGIDGIHTFAGFSSPFVLLPPIAQRFAQWVTDGQDDLMPQLGTGRFLECGENP